MKVICEKRREIEIVKSCRKEFCCKKLEEAFMDIENSHGGMYTTNLRVNKDRVEMIMHSSYDCNYDHEKINFCPFCGTEFAVENIEIDNTGLLPKNPPLKTVDMALGKKKHWWSK